MLFLLRLGADVCKCCFHGFHPSPFPLQTQTSWGPVVCCMMYAVCCFCKGFRPPLVDVVQGERLKCELVLFAWFPSIPILALANDILGSQCVLMLYACCLHVSCPSLKSCKLIHNVPLALMCALLFKRVAVPLHSCLCDAAVKLLCACCCPEPDSRFA